MSRLFVSETVSRPEVEFNGMRLTAFTRTWQLRLPLRITLIRQSAVWSRPASLLVTTPDGQETVLPIPDPTRNLVWMMLAAGLLAGIVARSRGLIAQRRSSS